jgi:hypothetical protein
MRKNIHGDESHNPAESTNTKPTALFQTLAKSRIRQFPTLFQFHATSVAIVKAYFHFFGIALTMHLYSQS